MNITLSPELQKRITDKVQQGDVETVDALVEEALHFYLDYEGGGMDEEDFRDARTAIDEALVQGERGEGRCAEDVFAGLRASHDLSR